MSEDLERRLRDVPARVPSPDPGVTRRVRHRLLRPGAPHLRRRAPAGLLAAVLAGIAIGYWVVPREEPAIGAADPPAVSIEAKPNVIRMYQPVEIAGAIVTREAGEYVAVEQNVCGRGWEPGSGGTTKSGGLFSATLTQSLANVRLRAKWRSSYSAVLSIGVRPWVVLRQKGPARFEAVVSTYRMLDGGAAQLQRYDRDSRQWKVAARAKLRPGSYGQETEALFRAKLPKRTIVRAVVPAASTKPCNLAGFSNMMTVG